jgi:hypothetical protein
MGFGGLDRVSAAIIVKVDVLFCTVDLQIIVQSNCGTLRYKNICNNNVGIIASESPGDVVVVELHADRLHAVQLNLSYPRSK